MSNLILNVLALFVVALAIPFRVPSIRGSGSGSDGRPIANLPRWGWLFGNDYEGLLGDKRGI